MCCYFFETRPRSIPRLQSHRLVHCDSSVNFPPGITSILACYPARSSSLVVFWFICHRRDGLTWARQSSEQIDSCVRIPVVSRIPLIWCRGARRSSRADALNSEVACDPCNNHTPTTAGETCPQSFADRFEPAFREYFIRVDLYKCIYDMHTWAPVEYAGQPN